MPTGCALIAGSGWLTGCTSGFAGSGTNCGALFFCPDPLADQTSTVVDLARVAHTPAPVAFHWEGDPPGPAHRIPGNGVYLRTDFWAPIHSGGSYGHTCYVAKSLAKMTDHLYCLMPHAYTLLNEMGLGLRQIVIDVPSATSTEADVARATSHYYKSLKPLLEVLRPAYIYERLCLGNYVGAKLSRQLNIPHIVEYNGSEITMQRSFAGRGYRLEDFYLRSEMAVFQQATVISVVSEPIKEDLVQRGIDPDKILVNPNGADPDDYRPASPMERTRLRAELGWDESHRVVGFTGTFGGWHGIDILAAGLPLICRAAPQVRFLLIGDGNFKHQIDNAIQVHQLKGQVHCAGRLEQAVACRLMRACDVFVSPHHRHMSSGRFFGSPTKIFEYMAVGAGIVSSDLEQIGKVLSPGLRAADLALDRTKPVITNQRAILCKPGDVEEFVRGVLALVQNPELSTALGRNARQAVIDHYSWDRHIDHLWRFMLQVGKANQRKTTFVPIDTRDAYKDQVQKQWDENPCGSHYVKNAAHHTLDWYREVEAHRFGSYAPWMPAMMQYAHFSGKEVLEIGGGLGTDLAQFASHGANVTDLDLSAGHLALAQENFRLRGLKGRFIHHDAEHLPFPDHTFDLVYSVGVIHHTPNTQQVVREIHRVLKPGGQAFIMVYAEHSLNYWRRLVYAVGLRRFALDFSSIGDVMSRHVEITKNEAKPLVKVYTARRIRQMFQDFQRVRICKRQVTRQELPLLLRRLPLWLAGRLMGWFLVVKATKA